MCPASILDKVENVRLMISSRKPPLRRSSPGLPSAPVSVVVPASNQQWPRMAVIGVANSRGFMWAREIATRTGFASSQIRLGFLHGSLQNPFLGGTFSNSKRDIDFRPAHDSKKQKTSKSLLFSGRGTMG